MKQEYHNNCKKCKNTFWTENAFQIECSICQFNSAITKLENLSKQQL